MSVSVGVCWGALWSVSRYICAILRVLETSSAVILVTLHIDVFKQGIPIVLQYTINKIV